MLLVIGLGNPGREYEHTRHNVGFEVLDKVAREHDYGSWKSLVSAKVAKGRIGEAEVLLGKPMTFMNLSGSAVGGLMRYFGLGPEALVVVHDDLDFEPGVVRLKQGGGHGGHNGLRSIFTHVSQEFARVRVGIGKPISRVAGADYVLSGFDKHERTLVNEAIVLAAEAVAKIAKDGVRAAMAEFNRKDEP